jgi:hypothetical protein
LYGAGCFSSRKGETLVAVRIGIAHNYVDIPSFTLVDIREIFIPINNSEVLLSAVCKPSGMHISLGSYASDASPYWQAISML